MQIREDPSHPRHPHLQTRCLPWMRESYLKGMTGERYLELALDNTVRELADLMLEFTVRCIARPAGVDNDLHILLSESILANQAISCPTLIIHDRCDPIVPFAHAQWAASQIPDAQICEVHRGGHLVWVGRDATIVLHQRCEFLREHIPG